jgi:hypothetical protein
MSKNDQQLLSRIRKKGMNELRQVSPLDNVLRIDGIRLDSRVTWLLFVGAGQLRYRYPKERIPSLEFARAAVPVFERHGLIYLIDPCRNSLETLPPRVRYRLKQDSKHPIWAATQLLMSLGSIIWWQWEPAYKNGLIIWPDERPETGPFTPFVISQALRSLKNAD